MNDAENSKIVVLSAPTCAGKTTLANHLVSKTRVEFATSATTRQPRSEEVDGEDYHFLSENEFQELIETDKLIEYETVHGNYYGTLVSELQGPNPVLLDIDVKGALTVKKQFREALLIFIAPPSIDVIKHRLRRRGEHDKAEIQRRLRRAKQEMTYQDRFDAVVVNDELSEAKNRVTNLVTSYLNESKNA